MQERSQLVQRCIINMCTCIMNFTQEIMINIAENVAIKFMFAHKYKKCNKFQWSF
jgi:hypothetical protein